MQSNITRLDKPQLVLESVYFTKVTTRRLAESVVPEDIYLIDYIKRFRPA